MNQKDMNDRRIEKGELVDIFNCHSSKERKANKFIAVAYSVPQGCCANYFQEKLWLH